MHRLGVATCLILVFGCGSDEKKEQRSRSGGGSHERPEETLSKAATPSPDDPGATKFLAMSECNLKAPATIQLLDGANFHLRPPAGQRIILLYVWASYSSFSLKKDLEYLQNLVRKRPPGTVDLVALNLDLDRDALKQFVHEQQVRVRVAVGANSVAASTLDLTAVPNLLVVDKNGTARRTRTGPMVQDIDGKVLLVDVGKAIDEIQRE